MTQINQISQTTSVLTNPEIDYEVSMSRPGSHLFEVKLSVKNWKKTSLNLEMPVWTPGSYLVREYAKHVQDWQAKDPQTGKFLVSRKLSKNHWQIDTSNSQAILITYRVYANELSVRTNHLNHTHGYFNGAALFCYIPNYEHQPITVKIIVPYANWRVTTVLPEISHQRNTFLAQDFDTLVDSPFEIGTHQLYEFTVLEKKHRLAVWGEGNFEAKKVIADIQKIIEVESNLYRGLPYSEYLFILHLSTGGYGGLEHKNCCTLNYSRFGFRATEKYYPFLQLVAHEFFHLWNVKRIRPQALTTFDYTQENYTTCLWFAEGVTSYYDLLIPLQGGIYDAKTFLANLSKDISKYLSISGRHVQSLSESSFDAWIKLYRRDTNSDNSQISYYLKGSLVSLLLDLLIRSRHQNQRSLDDVMRLMWQSFGQEENGYSPLQLQEAIASVAGTDLTDFFRLYIEGTAELPLNEYLHSFGLKIKPIFEAESIPDLGIQLEPDPLKTIVRFVRQDSPAALAGISPGDELLAINQLRVNSMELKERLKDYQAGDMIVITLFHQDQLRAVSLELASPQPSGYEIISLKELSDQQRQNYLGWLKSEI
ncbi:M61 family metallopeptidase [Gloeocapsa sp. PCC 73106]|uniref:M61 family metallopeptidase n=1 Tax=Gloeocapsa sp. PCC 73106 TaxID=102232 RepID=UPI0002ABAE1A|nr:M61 family metallopeptidase [Gloeocapsa sp. PCC 73106]ELR99379.1 putative protease with the C-terminal PDZ domain [Gloeocapsa sp. PCC 73106]